jgi:transposase
MSGTKRRKRKKPSDYEPEPTLPPQLEERYALVLAAISGAIKIEHAAKRAGLSRPRFQTLMHRAQASMIESLVPKPPGRPPRSAREAELEQQVQKLSRQNEKLQDRVDTIDRLLGVASDMLTGRMEISKPRSKRKGRQKTTAPDSEQDGEDPDPAEAKLAGAQEMRKLGLKPQLAAALVGAGTSTVRRWARGVAGRSAADRRQRRAPG